MSHRSATTGRAACAWLEPPCLRAAMTGFLEAAHEVADTGQFGFLDRCVTTPELNHLMGT